jgi:putative Ca2+/H+ antiporter (TMEM165/GDT1 family)
VRISIVLTTFAVILLAELPDKSLFASLILGTRFHPFGVWVGVAAAFAVHVVLAVAIGEAISLLPARLVASITALLFAIGAYILLFRASDGDEADESGRAVRVGPPPTVTRALATSFGIVFLGEMGDVTQITTANLAARYGDPLSVGLGALLGLWTAAALAVTVGRGLLRVVRPVLLRRAAGCILGVLAVLSAIEAVRG